MSAAEADKMDVDVLPSTETADAPVKTEDAEESNISDEQWAALRDAVTDIMNYREDDGHDPSKVFHKKVNKRNIPTYYDVIKEPMAFSSINGSLRTREYKDIKAFVRDCALIWHNAHTFNRPDAGAYLDANVIKRQMEEKFRGLVTAGIMTAEEAEWPDLGEIPPVEEIVDEGSGEDEDEEEDEDDDGDESDEGRAKRGLRRRKSDGPAATTKGSTAAADSALKKRGRPPKVDTPMETRIKNIIKGLKRIRNDQNMPSIYSFEKLPDKAIMPEYYLEIKQPMSVELIKKSLKRKRYHSVDAAMKDFDLMFNNAKQYNEDESEIFKAAVALQEEARKLAEEEKAKPDAELDGGDGRKPRPEGIMYKDERWAAGDWVHIKNPNDATKPIIAQIYRTWEDDNGHEWMNACWYYRPEQIVHHFEKHFWPNEVFKTGQYRDHRIEELVDHCFVMFYTRYTRGRPRGLPHTAEVYVCEARYNEEKHKVNKIKTWASCLPDEVRDRDYEMDLFDNANQRRIKKQPSPLLPFYKDKLQSLPLDPPKARWGAENAPPIQGALFGGPRDENQSPPPEATPEPTPQQLALKNTANTGLRPGLDSRTSDLLNRPMPGGYSNPAVSAYAAQLGGQNRTAAAVNSYQYPPRTSALGQTPQANQYALQNNARYSITSQPVGVPGLSGAFYLHAGRDAIPEDIRKEFQQDDEGNVIFFSQPPVRNVAKEDLLPKLSLKFRAARLRRKIAEQAEKRKEIQEQQDSQIVKRQKTDAKPELTKKQATKFWQEWISDLNRGTEDLYKSDFGDRWEQVKKFDQTLRMQNLAAVSSNGAEDGRTTREKQWLQTRQTFAGQKVYKDDFDPRF